MEIYVYIKPPPIDVNLFFLLSHAKAVFAEELFEVAACYFPVDFQPRSKDADAITRDTLSDALSHCLAASPKFAQVRF